MCGVGPDPVVLHRADMSRPEHVIAGLGLTPQGRVYDHSYVGFAVEAVRLALEDAGLDKDDLDGLLVNPADKGETPLPPDAETTDDGAPEPA